MRRRTFIAGLGAAAAWPLAARGQQAGKLPTIGFVGADAAVWSTWTAAFVKRLSELGWVENRTIAIEYRWSAGRPDRDAEIASEFARLKVDVIVANDASVPALKQATSIIPIVFVLATDPVGAGIVPNLARPGGNITGMSIETADLASKKVALLREVAPRLRRLAIMFDAAYRPSLLETDEVQAAAAMLGLEVTRMEIRRLEDVAPAFAALNGQADGLFVVGSALVAAARTRIVTFSLSGRLPTMFNNRVHTQAGGLMSYGPNFLDQLGRAAEYVDKILRGAKAGDLPVEQPSRFELVVNLTTAKALGLTIPESFLLLADEVIE
jgi:putative ABC transport system substrate-binding protein